MPLGNNTPCPPLERTSIFKTSTSHRPTNQKQACHHTTTVRRARHITVEDEGYNGKSKGMAKHASLSRVVLLRERAA